MREIKFRAWTGEQMISPDYIGRDGKAYFKENSIPSYSDKVMQYTGLKDNNGIPIYEGDIIKWSTERYRSCYEEKPENPNELIKIEWKSPVEWEDAGFVVTESFDLEDKNNTWLIAVADKCEVIGNIYEKETQHPQSITNPHQEEE